MISILLSKFVFLHWKEEPLDELFDAVGIVIILSGFLLRISARGYKEEKSNSGMNLVKDGPYYLMRHPMYFGTLLIGSGIISALFELWTFAIFLLIYFLIYIPQINKEEKAFFRRFGEEYKVYCKATPKYFPKFRVNFREYLPLKLAWIKKELFSLTAVIGTILAIEVWEDLKAFGYNEFPQELLELFVIILFFAMISYFFLRREAHQENKTK